MNIRLELRGGTSIKINNINKIEDRGGQLFFYMDEKNYKVTPKTNVISILLNERK